MQKSLPEKEYKKILKTVRAIPEGKVATYGQVARIAGFPRHARQVGYALHRVSNDTDIPWYRVINAQGKISFPKDSEHYSIQKAILEQEGVTFTKADVINLLHYQWNK